MDIIMSKLARCWVLFVVTMIACVVDAPVENDDQATNDEALVEDTAQEAAAIPDPAPFSGRTAAATTTWHRDHPADVSPCAYCHAAFIQASPDPSR